jgi:hypothetical protein
LAKYVWYLQGEIVAEYVQIRIRIWQDWHNNNSTKVHLIAKIGAFRLAQ